MKTRYSPSCSPLLNIDAVEACLKGIVLSDLSSPRASEDTTLIPIMVFGAALRYHGKVVIPEEIRAWCRLFTRKDIESCAVHFLTDIAAWSQYAPDVNDETGNSTTNRDAAESIKIGLIRIMTGNGMFPAEVTEFVTCLAELDMFDARFLR